MSSVVFALKREWKVVQHAPHGHDQNDVRGGLWKLVELHSAANVLRRLQYGRPEQPTGGCLFIGGLLIEGLLDCLRSLTFQFRIAIANSSPGYIPRAVHPGI